MTNQGLTPNVIARAEALVSRIQGISSCRISTDESGMITEIHVVATGRKSPKLVARDVETCLKAEMGIHVDYKKIGVAVFDSARSMAAGEGETVAVGAGEAIVEFPIEEHPARFAFRSVNLFISEDSIQAEVELIRQGLETFGSSRSENLSTSPLKVVAEATLKAVSEILDEPTKLCLSEVVEVPLGEEIAVLVRVDLLANRQSKSLAGCSLVSNDINQTVVFATLDAVNRVLGKLKSKSSIEYKIR